jgi:two-component system response regulator YesN
VPRVLIVEDEPAAGRYLRSMIELKRPDFSVVGIAENGLEALGEVRLHMPDLVITDVRMPVMDGIEFVAELKKGYPELPVVIVSGHQEFEYARRALDTGVVDYLLKPVDPIRLAEVLDRLGSMLSAREGARMAEALSRFVKGESCGAAGLPLAPGECFRLAIVRVGGLPSRFGFDAAGGGEPSCEDGFFIFSGRDSRERILLARKDRVSPEVFIERARAAAAASGAYSTVLAMPGASRADELRRAAREACLAVDRLIVPGLSRLHFAATELAPEIAWDKALSDRIEFALRESRADLLEGAIRGMAEAWRASLSPLISIESQLRRILHLVLRKAPHANGAVASNLEFLLEEALAGMGGFDELSDAAWSLVAGAAGVEDLEFRDSGVPAFFHAIGRFVEAHYSESVTLGDLSGTFRISPSYLSKLFRKHAGRSFGEFLAAIRIEAAKRLIRESPDMPLKDVAEKVGFNDPFYFSRVFKSIAGLPPSDYSRLGKGDSSRGPECPKIHS